MQANYTLRLHLFLPFLFAALFVLRPVADQSEATRQALRGVDKAWSLKLGSKTDKDALSYLKKEAPGLFGVKSEAEFYNPAITRYGDTITKIKDQSSNEKNTLKEFYKNNIENISNTPLKDLYIADLEQRGIQNAKAVWEGIKNTPEGLKFFYEYLDTTPIEEIGSDAVDGIVHAAKGIKNTVSEGIDAYQSASEIAYNTDNTADLLNELYNDKTAATAGRLMVDEDLFEAVTLVGGAAKGIVQLSSKAILGITKLPKGKFKVKLDNGKTVEVPHIGSIHPDPTLNKNIEETMSYIMNGEKPPRKLGYNPNPEYNKWGVEYRNNTKLLPTLDKSGNPIKYKEYRVRTPQGGENVHRIVVGSDGKYYYSNTHYGQSKVYKGIPSYEASK